MQTVYLILLGRGYIIAVSIAEPGDYYGGFVVRRVVHDFLDGLTQSSSGHCREFAGHAGEHDVADQGDLRRDDLRLPLIGELHLKSEMIR